MGAGADATIHADQGNQGTKQTVQVRYNQYPSHYMKAYLRFDLRQSAKAKDARPVAGLVAHLVMQLAGKPDADHTINIFGLIERKSYGGTTAKPILGVDWAEGALTYANAPAGSSYGGGAFTDGKEAWQKGKLGGVDHEHVMLLGTLKITKGQEGEVIAPLPTLPGFIAEHAPSKVPTLILCRVTSSENSLSFHAKEAAPYLAPKLAFAAP